MSSDRPYAAHPHLHGDLLVFTADREVWGVPVTGGRARRLTSDGARVSHPRVSPDGRLLAWTSSRDGTPEAYAVPLAGGTPRRLTHFGHPRTRVAGWTLGGEVVVLTPQHTHSPLATWAWSVPPEGGPAQRLPYGPVGDLAYGPRGEVLLRSVGMLPQSAYWKRYRGGAVGRLWISRAAADGDGAFARVVPEGHGEREADLECPLWLAGPDGSGGSGGIGGPDGFGGSGGRGDRIAFLSDLGGRARLWSSLPDGSDARPHTPEGAHPGFAARNAATDGTRVVYQSGGDLWLLADASPYAEAERVDVRLPEPRGGRAPFAVSGAEEAGDFSGGPGDADWLLEVRGTVHVLPEGDALPVALSRRPGVRCRLPRALGRTGGVAWVSDVEGADALEVLPGRAARAAAPAAPRVLAAGRLGRVLELCASPDGASLAVAAHDGRVLVVDTASGAVTELDRSAREEVTGLAFSPDSAWLAWSHPGPEGLRQIRLARAAGGGAVVEATEGRCRDESPAFTPDGAHLAFVSDGVFDPEYQTHVLDLAFLAAKRPQLLSLRADTPSLLADIGGDGGDGGAEGAEGAEGAARPAPPRTRVDAEGLPGRVVAFPVPAAEYGGLRAVGGALLWVRTPPRGTLGDAWAGTRSAPPRPRVERWDLATGVLSVLREGADGYAASADGGRVLVRDGKALSARAVAGPPGSGERPVDPARIRVTVDPVAEWRQAFAEDERLMRDNVWRSGLPELAGGGPWSRYRPLLERIGCAEEFTDLLWETHGDLGWSHTYVWPRAAEPDRERPGLLGADLAPDGDGNGDDDGDGAGTGAGGGWRIVRIVPGERSVPQARSPLAAPGTGLGPGDVLLAVDGRPVDPSAGPAPLLRGTADRPVELTVRPASGGPVRRVTVVPLASEAALRYHDLVRTRRARVRARTGGRLGYVHVPDMVASGWAQLHRDLRAEAGRDGLLVDFRENAGGHLSALVLERLTRRPVGWQLRRGNPPQSYPPLAALGPLVFLADELSGSDGDNVVAAVRARGLGPVVGVRTWGGVRAMEVGHGLVDGTRLVHPRGAFWFAHGGWDLENAGVAPDVEVTVAPHQRAAGDDPQLDAAIDVALAACARTPATRPPELPGA
ncbi:S41 family peptidase [Streptomyces termitum]|uniref:Tricorn protease homolog n=1 Tax=Streptomyces termitum TaxID=67368 RepID=A0A918TCC5_9ACTN|nr:S41 family peptidase [Streptomyces termitum]GHB07343.1 tricorn protease [Streptomyces termitum]